MHWENPVEYFSLHTGIRANPFEEGLLLPPNEDQIRWALDEKAAWIVDMHPRLFLELTSVPPHFGVEYWLRTTATLDVWRSSKFQSDMQAHPYLSLDQETGKIASHDGRHRAAAVLNAGGKWYRVAIVPRPSSRRWRPEDKPRIWEAEFHDGYVIDVDQAVREGTLRIVNDRVQEQYWDKHSTRFRTNPAHGHYWFEPGFDRRVKQWILANQHPCDTGMYCHEDSRRWALALHARGERTALHAGVFYVGGDTRRAAGHSWVVVNGRIFDPTASQFPGKKYEDWYESREEYDGDEIAQSRTA